MNLLLRTLILLMKSRFAPRLHLHDVARLRMRVLPNDLDVLGHMNNGKYFSLMDFGRINLLIRSGGWAKMNGLGIAPVAASETMSFRRSLKGWQRYILETKVVGYDEKAVYMEQRFVVDREVYAQAFVRGRFIRRGSDAGGPVTMAELGDALGIDTAAFPPPQWMLDWADDVAMPPARASFTTDW